MRLRLPYFILLAVSTAEIAYKRGSAKADSAHIDIHNEAAKGFIKHEAEQLDPEHNILPESDKMSGTDESLMWFLMSDKDGDKLLDGHELLLALNEGMDVQTGLPLKESIEHVDTILKEDDEDGDGKISYEEFLGSTGGD